MESIPTDTTPTHHYRGTLSMIAIELGWIFSEIGRQPWIIWKVMKTTGAATTNANVGSMLILFGLLYIFLGKTCVKVLRKMFRENPAELEIMD
jgi:cytochrome d ubiquinol oxidase subunit I